MTTKKIFKQKIKKKQVAKKINNTEAISLKPGFCKFHMKGKNKGAGATFDWLFFDNSKVINFDD